MKTKEECKNEIAKINNFDSFEKAIRYTFNRGLLHSEKEFIDKIIDEAMDKYAQELLQHSVSKSVGDERRALLIAFVNHIDKKFIEQDTRDAMMYIDGFLESN